MAPARDETGPPTGMPPPGAAWGEALERHRHAWWAYAMHLTRHHTHAEDLVQDMLLKVIARAVRPEEVAPGYPFRVMKNAWLSHGRKRRVREASAHVPVVARDDTPHTGALTEAIASLPEEQREVLTLKHAGSLTIEQIALVTGRPLGTVASQHRRAISALRDRLSPREESAR